MNETPVIPAFLDANVLYPAIMRDVLLHLASRGAFSARWSAQVQYGPVRRKGAYAPWRIARNATASEAFDAAVKMAFLSAFMTVSQWSRYCA